MNKMYFPGCDTVLFVEMTNTRYISETFSISRKNNFQRHKIHTDNANV